MRRQILARALLLTRCAGVRARIHAALVGRRAPAASVAQGIAKRHAAATCVTARMGRQS